MSAYGKPQPQPPLNDAYYGPPIPPPPAAAYYSAAAAPPAPRRSGAHRLFCCLFRVLAVAVIALGTAVLVLWLIFRPNGVKAYADTAALSRFDLTNTGGRAGSLLVYNLTVGMRVHNPNRFGINFRSAEAQASYDGDRFRSAPLQPFYVGRKSDAKFDVTLSGSAAIDDGDVERTYRRETAQRFYKVKVRVYARQRFKVRGFRLNNKSKFTCTLNLPAPSSGSGTASATPTTMVFTRCDVDY